MFFRNLILFRFSPELDLSGLDAGMDDFALKPVGPLEMASRGWVSPFGRGESQLSHRVGTGIWLAVGGEDKILPVSVINDEVAHRAAEIEEREGRRIGGRYRKRLKDEVLHDLLPRAFVRTSRVQAHIDTALGFFAVDTSSRKVAEAVVSEVRQTLGSFPVLPLNAMCSPRSVLTGWLAGNPLPEGLHLGDECELRDPADKGALVRMQRQEMEGEEIAQHLESGKQCARLALLLDDHLSFVFGDDLVVRKLKFLDGAVESLENTERDSVRAELDARYALMIGELKRLFAVLEGAFSLSKVEGGPKTPGPREGVQTRMAEVDQMAPAPDAISDSNEPDPLFDQAVASVTESRSGSISTLQRRLKLGYNRAARLIESMELAGVVSAPAPDGKRRVLAKA